MGLDGQQMSQERWSAPMRGFVSRRVRAWVVMVGFIVLAACGGSPAPNAGADPVTTTRLLVSESGGGETIAELAGRTLTGTVAIVAEAAATVVEVGFYLNDDEEPVAVARSRPFLFLLDTTSLADGEHRITAATSNGASDGSSVVAEAAFRVANGGDPNDPPAGGDDPSDPPAGGDDPSDPPAGGSGGVLGSVVGVVHAPFVEWRVEVGEVAGVSPWDVRAFATFTRRGDGEVWRVPWFYAGGGVFALRFTGPRVGVYDVRSSSAEVAGLDGLAGLVTIEANPDANAKGFLTSVGNAFGYLVGDGSAARRTLYNVHQRHDQARSPAGWETVAQVPVDVRRPFEGLGERIEVMLDEVATHGMQALYLMVAHNSTSFPSAYNTPYRSGRETPDETTFAILEEVLERAHARGLFVHFWLWADSEAGASSATLPGGVNGWLDQRLNHYFVARLGAYPNWSMSLGYDLNEWVTPAQARAWAEHLRASSTLPRLYLARESQDGATHQTPFHLGADKLDVFSTDQRVTGGYFADARARFAAVDGALPVMYERRFLHTRDGEWDMQSTRRAMWQFTLAGGAAGIYGVLWGPGPDYPNPEQLATIARFWEQRFAFPLRPRSNPVDGLVTRDGEARQVVYKEDTRSITIVIPSGVTNLPVIAVDARAAYAEIDLGSRGAGTHTITLPTRSDWALAIGHFDNP